MKSLRFTLVSEGSSDRALLPVLEWAITQHEEVGVTSNWADLRKLPNPPKTLEAKIRDAMELYPCDLMFVHRDADRVGIASRVREIEKALSAVQNPPAVCVVPVRTTEAWLLFDEATLRRAAGNPNGSTPLELPAGTAVESLPDPKKSLMDALRTASEHKGRRLQRFQAEPAIHRIAKLLQDFSPLRDLPAFQAFEKNLQRALGDLMK